MKSAPIIAVIPARYASTRFPGKPLATIHGKPLLQWVWEPKRPAESTGSSSRRMMTGLPA
ncbi:MAG: hypothetical protein EBT57_02765 [Verrucomicrobia bacterium]|nr:hypothetical protein [Verrucomicrobiota bacterium]